MGIGDGSEPVDDDEILYRRIPQSWYSSETEKLNDQAFAPHKKNDTTGLSVSRAKYKSIEDAAKGTGECYYVGILKAGDLKKAGIPVVPKPLANDPAHAEIPGLNTGNRKDSRTLELQEELVRLTQRVEGPFSSSPASSE